jgi:hypothetical protein
VEREAGARGRAMIKEDVAWRSDLTVTGCYR